MNGKKHIFYFDALRALAIISVILVHVFDGGTRHLIVAEYSAVPSLNWFICSFIINFFRIGVPLFLKLSGALSLGRDWTIRSFLGKRLPRIIYPFVFWLLFLSVMLVLINSFIHPLKIHGLFSLITVGALGKNNYFYQDWFFWMILGTYLIMPIFNKWIQHSEMKELEYFLSIWLITCIFDFTLRMQFPIKLSYFTSPIGLVVLGYYLRYTERELFNKKYFAVLLIIFSIASMMICSYMFSNDTLIYRFDRYAIFMALNAAGVFLLFKNFNFNPKGIIRDFITRIAQYSYGIYLAHVAVLSVTIEIFEKTLPYNLWTISLVLVTLFVPMGLLYIFSKVPYLKDIIGVK
ncbi:MAG: acyltransferase family protein [Methanobrevibacter sp.]|nr:acyltransferase family protein [Methanobrevibacter sp.]